MKNLMMGMASFAILTGCTHLDQNEQNTQENNVSVAAIAEEAPAPERTLAKFEPPQGKVLVFVGQDNESVGGTEQFRNGYVDHLGVPAGITHYVYFTEGKSNRFGAEFDVGTVDGLNSVTSWAAGPMCMRCYTESEKLDGTLLHLSISMEHDDEPAVAAGEYDHNIDELVAFLKEYNDRVFYLRIGYEFDGSWNSYEPEEFKAAWRRIVDKLRAEGVENFATVLATYSIDIADSVWEEYWPGDEYVDWIGSSYWSGGQFSSNIFEFARRVDKPVFLAEVTPRGFRTNESEEMIWHDWFRYFFTMVEENDDVVKAIAYINADWDVQPMWEGRGWGDTRIEINEHLKERWLAKMAEDRYVHSVDGLNELVGFKSPMDAAE